MKSLTISCALVVPGWGWSTAPFGGLCIPLPVRVLTPFFSLLLGVGRGVLHRGGQGCCNSSSIAVSKQRKAEMAQEKAAMTQGLDMADSSGDGMLDLDEVRCCC